MKKGKHILVLTYWSFKDPLIQAYTLPYLPLILHELPAGSRISLVCFEQERLAMKADEEQRIIASLREKGIDLITFPYRKFGPTAPFTWLNRFRVLTGIIGKEKVDLLHAWCTPAGAMAYILSRITGKPFVIDSYEPHAEAMVENGDWKRSSISFRLLFRFEKIISRKANALIGTTAAMKDYALKKYGAVTNRFTVKPACVDPSPFREAMQKREQFRKSKGWENKTVLVYAGKFGGIYLYDEAFALFAAAHRQWKDDLRILLLTPHRPDEMNRKAAEHGLPEEILEIRFVPHAEIPSYLTAADLAITPVKPIPTKRYCTPIKDGEYWAAGLPVIITKDISDDSGIIEREHAGAVLSNFDRESMDEAIRKCEVLLSGDRIALRDRITAIADRNRSYGIAAAVYRQIYGVEKS